MAVGMPGTQKTEMGLYPVSCVLLDLGIGECVISKV